MVTRIEVTRSQNESSTSLMRRFSKRVQGLNLIRKVKSLKTAERPKSPYKKKMDALKRIAKRADMERQRKLGKIADVAGKKSN